MKNIHKPTQSQKPGEPQPVHFLTREKCQAQPRPDPSTSSYWKRCKPVPFSPQTAIWRQISFSTHVGKAKRFVYICQKATVKTTLQYGQYLGVCLGKKQTGSFPCLATPSTLECRPGMALSPPHFLLVNLILVMSCPIVAFHFSMQTSHVEDKTPYSILCKMKTRLESRRESAQAIT